MAKASIRPGPAFCAPAAVSTKMPVPMTLPMPEQGQLEGAERAMERFLRGGRQDRIERFDTAEHQVLRLIEPRTRPRSLAAS